MFSNLILRNSRRSRKENGLFFSSLVISIVAFYIILSLAKQDVMIFLAKMESDAVSRLLLLIPVFYGVTLAILFFLIYFACKYQLERRRKEFGVYLMMGMRRSRLFTMLLAENLVSSALALVIGLPVSVLLSELISLVTAKAVGMGILGHQFTFLLSAVGLTVAGFLVINLLAFLILSYQISRQEIGTLLAQPTSAAKRSKPAAVYGVSAALGILLLAAAYRMAIRGIAWQSPVHMLLALLLGILGTILLFYGLRTGIAFLTKGRKAGSKLHVFTFRQIQESVIHQSTSMAISSLLILAALCCFGAGLGTALTNPFNGQKEADHVLDYTFCDYETEDPEQILPHLQSVLQQEGLQDQFSQLFAVRLGHIQAAGDSAFQMEPVMAALRALPPSEDRDILLNNLGYVDYPYLICLSDYNRLLQAAGQPTLDLAAGEAAVYQDTEMSSAPRRAMMGKILEDSPEVLLDGDPFHLIGEIQTVDLVTDRSISLSFALILSDEAFLAYTKGGYEVYVNGILNQEETKENSLMTVISNMNARLDQIDFDAMGIEYESYLQNMGRQLFYLVAASYITIYLAIIFLVVANTIMGVQFLMQQQRTGRRYQTLVRLGASYQDLCSSARKQVNWFMGLPVLVAAMSSIFGVQALFTGLISSSMQGQVGKMLLVAAAMILLLCVVEYLYVTVIKRASDRYLLTQMQSQREE